MSQMSTAATASYPSSSVPAESYPKLPLSGGSNYTAEPQQMSLPTSMPSVGLPLVSNEHPSEIRTQYAYVPGTRAPSPMAASTPSLGSADHRLRVPRYMDSNSRPTKSPRHPNNPQSVQSSSTTTTTSTASPEYRYGPPYVPVNSNSSESYSAENSSSNHAHSQPPARDYYPPSSSWTTTAGEPAASVSSYHSSESRPYSLSEAYKTGHAVPPVRTEQPSAPGAYASTLNHYSWSPT